MRSIITVLVLTLGLLGTAQAQWNRATVTVLTPASGTSIYDRAKGNQREPITQPTTQATQVYLLRSSLVASGWMYVATFDVSAVEYGSADKQRMLAYNTDNCLTAAKLFQSQPGTLTRFECSLQRTP